MLLSESYYCFRQHSVRKDFIALVHTDAKTKTDLQMGRQHIITAIKKGHMTLDNIFAGLYEACYSMKRRWLGS